MNRWMIVGHLWIGVSDRTPDPSTHPRRVFPGQASRSQCSGATPGKLTWSTPTALTWGQTWPWEDGCWGTVSSARSTGGSFGAATASACGFLMLKKVNATHERCNSKPVSRSGIRLGMETKTFLAHSSSLRVNIIQVFSLRQIFTSALMSLTYKCSFYQRRLMKRTKGLVRGW